jgi:hypothetical protein
MKARPLLWGVCDVALDWSIWRRFPDAKPLKEADRATSAKFGLALCEFAFELSPDDPWASKVFKVGTGILDVTAYQPMLPQIQALHEHPLVKRDPTWTWAINRVLLNFPETANAAVLESLSLELPKELSRDGLVTGLLTREIHELPVEEATVRTVARLVLDDCVSFVTKKNRKQAIRAAKDWTAKGHEGLPHGGFAS